MADGVGERLGRVRTAQSMAARELAQKSGVAYGEIVRLESSPRAGTDQATLQRLAEALGTTTDYLTDGREPDPAALRFGLIRRYGAMSPDEREALKFAPIQQRISFVLRHMQEAFPDLLDRRQMAARLGYTPEALDEVLSDTAPLQSHLLKRLAAQVGLPVDFFVRGDFFGGADDVRSSDPARMNAYYEVVQEAIAEGISPAILRKALRILVARDES